MITNIFKRAGVTNILALCLLTVFISFLLYELQAIASEDSTSTSRPGTAIKEVSDIVTGDIQEGIEKHIAEQVELGNGYFRVPFEDGDLQLELVRIHTEYLASLSPTRHFACIDMVSSDGEFYDIDFFMEGPRGNMQVTETTVHKINGKPLYLWEQAADKTWGRVPVDKASKELLGILSGRDHFLFRYQANIPSISKEAKMWVPLAQSDKFQNVKIVSIQSPVKYEILTDSAYGNKALFLTLGPEHSGQSIVINYEVERIEKNAYDGNTQDALRFLVSESKVQSGPAIKARAKNIVAGKEGALMQARALYDNVIDSMAYKRCGAGWGQGDVCHAEKTLSGNCTDFHSYFIALARSIDIPARFAIGVSIPSDRDEGGVHGYHCWAEFYADGKWWPVDISEANKFTALSMYYFGHHPANRFEFTQGRDLVFEPGPQSGPINFLAYPILETDGEQKIAKIMFGFERKK